MNDTIENSTVLGARPSGCHTSTRLAVDEACRRIPPLWPLKDFVAVNPFLGLSNLHFLEAAALLRRTAHGDILMPDNYYLQRLDAGDISGPDIQEAVSLARMTLPDPWSKFLGDYTADSLRQELLAESGTDKTERTLTVADCLDLHYNTQWAPFVTEEISKWCSVYFDEGQSSWRMPWRDRPFYTAWREAARHDANPGLSGLKTFAGIMQTLPQDPGLAIQEALETLEIPIGLQVDFLHRQLLSISGWSSYVQYQVRQNLMPGEGNQGLAELLAVRLAYDLALRKLGQSTPDFDRLWQEKLVSMQNFQPDLGLLPRYLLQIAMEKSYQRRLSTSLRSQAKVKVASATRPSLHAIFCIDVRSEIYRRHLEARNAGILTSGFAGFFGMAIEYVLLGQERGSAQCPVLLSPAFKVREGLQNGGQKALEKTLRKQLFDKQLNYSWNSFKTSAVSCFSFVETAGLFFGLKLGRDALALSTDSARSKAPATRPQLTSACQHNHSQNPGHTHDSGIPSADQLNLAESALRNLGLTSGFARLVLFCGHGSATNNNPYASGLDCGACGGHAGQVNARIAANILNEPAVREGLKHRGIEIPADTHFLAGQHTTTTDDVELFEEDAVPASHLEEWNQTIAWLQEASRHTRTERSPRLGLSPDDSQLEQKIRTRSRDWAQVRPEWGLAANAALIAAPRERTKKLNLAGRTFLHDYEHSGDPDSKVLELILTAPVVVANWINLQYYASTANNRLFGSGNKTIHNVVGALGIWQGNGGDLQTGLPMQSLHDGTSWVHEPLRLGVFIEAPREKIHRVLLKHPAVGELADNQWLHLFAMEDFGSSIFHYGGKGRWTILT